MTTVVFHEANREKSPWPWAVPRRLYKRPSSFAGTNFVRGSSSQRIHPPSLEMLLCASVFVVLLALGTSSPAPDQRLSLDRVPPGGFPPGITIPPCKFFCKEPLTDYYHCCDHIRPGKCPTVRLECPDYRIVSPPNECYNDSDCSEDLKCCSDVCLNHKTCKPAEYN
ncbi:antileukoproteinase-like [Oratosquilla oratoria]|uniref:antileukoproteinase-like n=1 Tax=Oratosquilla oratoria TaxID=337810 RepID=UPI003F77481C